MRATSNPTIKRIDNEVANGSYQSTSGAPATWLGMSVKTIVLVLLATISAVVTSSILKNALTLENTDTVLAMLAIAGISVLPLVIISFVIFRVPKIAPVLAVIYSLLMGVTLGLITSFVELAYPGVALMAVLGTFTVLVVTMTIHRLLGGRLSSSFRRFVFVALISLVVVQLLGLVISLFTPAFASIYYANFGMQVVASSICIVIATLTLLVDIDNMARIAESGLDKKYEWLAAFGLTSALLWLYIEILRLLAVIMGRK